MVVVNGIDAFVRRKEDGKRYDEYTIPLDSPKYTGEPNEVYIKAVTGESFEIVVQLTANFDFQGCGAVQVACTIDTNDP